MRTDTHCAIEVRQNRQYNRTALTLIEMIMAMAIMVIIFAALVPQFRNIRINWDSKSASAETVQNGRVLIDHLCRKLESAVRITAVSDSNETNGYIEFEENDGNTLRYDVAANKYVEFGPVGDLSDLAGPVRKLQFTCYDDYDFVNAVTDINSIRFVIAETTLTNSYGLGQDKNFMTSVYLRTNGSYGAMGNRNEESYDLLGLNTQFATQAQLTDSTTVSSIFSYVKGQQPKYVRCAIYTDNSGEPDLLIVESGVVEAGSNKFHWHETNIATTVLSAGTYWIAIAFEHALMNIKQSEQGLGQTREKKYDAVTNGFLPQWGASDDSSTRRMSIYASIVLP